MGWTLIDGAWYYFNESHDNEVNWYPIGNGFYESLNKKVKAYGSMFKNEVTPDGFYVNSDGRRMTLPENSITLFSASVVSNNVNNNKVSVKINGNKNQTVNSSNGNCIVKFLDYELECDNTSEMSSLKRELKEQIDDLRTDWKSFAEDGYKSIEETDFEVISISRSLIRFEYKVKLIAYSGIQENEEFDYYIDWDRDSNSISAELKEYY